LHGLGVEALQFHVDVTQDFLEVEVFVLFLRGDTNVAAGSEAPVVGLDLLATYQLNPSLSLPTPNFADYEEFSQNRL
jgi:hypothetical protein